MVQSVYVYETKKHLSVKRGNLGIKMSGKCERGVILVFEAGVTFGSCLLGSDIENGCDLCAF